MRFGPKLVAALIILPAVLTQTAANNKVGPCLESLIISGFFTSGGIIQPTPCCSLWIATQSCRGFGISKALADVVLIAMIATALILYIAFSFPSKPAYGTSISPVGLLDSFWTGALLLPS
jgi:hypothetical protein